MIDLIGQRATLRAEFNGKSSNSSEHVVIEADYGNGDYTLMQAHLAWLAWQAAIQWSKYV